MVLGLAIYFLTVQWKQRRKKSLDAKSKEIQGGDGDSIVPLVLGDTKEKESIYDYEESTGV